MRRRRVRVAAGGAGLPAEAVSVFGNNARRVVLLCVPAGRQYRREMYRRHAAQPQMPIMNPKLALREVRAQAAAALPGSRVRWLVHWRYELTWRKPDRALERLASINSSAPLPLGLEKKVRLGPQSSYA